MFLSALSVLVCLVVANSIAQREQQLEAIESRVARDRYSVPQEIRDRVPVDFAAMNLRKSRLKNQNDRNTLRRRPDVVDKTPKASLNQPKHLSASKNTTRPSKYRKQKGSTRRRLIGDKSVRPKKTQRLRTNSLQDKYSTTSTQRPTEPSKEAPFEVTNFEKNAPPSVLHTAISTNALKQTSGNSFANIKKAINALPQQTVMVVRDDIDCNDDPTKNLQNTRGPPCTFSLRWPGTGGHPAFWLNNVFPQNWELFY